MGSYHAASVLHQDLDLIADGQRKYPNSRLLASSATGRWRSIFAELRSHPVGEISSAVQKNVEIVIAMEGTENGTVIRSAGGRIQQANASPKAVWLVPMDIGAEEILLTAAMPKTLHLYLPVGQLQRTQERFNLPQSSPHSIEYLGGLHDDLIYGIGTSLLSEIVAPTSTGSMLAEAASLTLAARLFQKYQNQDETKHSGAVSYKLNDIRVRRVLNYIETHLEEDLTVANLADIANLSPFHFTRMFSATLGVSPNRYISRRRLENAKSMIKLGRLPLTEIAHRSCFSSQASFNRAFRRATGMSPGEFRRLSL
jgi:AraC family transcriptional regulator